MNDSGYGDVGSSFGSALGSSRRPAEGFGTAQVGTPSFGKMTR